jgi:hypothetical protein
MLAPLGYFLFTLVVACSTILLGLWAYDTGTFAIGARRSHPADSEFDFDSPSNQWRPYSGLTDELGFPLENWHAA